MLSSKLIKEAALAAGADDFIMRPFDEDIIASKLKIVKILRGGK